MFLLFVHFIGCTLIVASRKEIFEHPNNWIKFMDLEDESSAYQYLTSVYWAVLTLLAVGYGDIIPITTIEKSICSLIFILGVGLMSYILSTSTN